MPVQYSGIKNEHAAVRDRAGLFDVSHMGELLIEGPGALSAVDRLVTNDIATLAPGQARYTVCCNALGMVLDDLIVYRLADERFLVVCNASNRNKISEHFAREIGDTAEFDDATERYALLALQGPAAEAILRDAGAPETLTSLAPFHVAEGNVAETSVWAARTGYTGEDGFELFCATSEAVALWRKLLEAGAEHGLLPVGLGARDTLRLEARLMLYGNELTEETHPLEARLGWVVKLDGADFVGREALRAIKEAGYPRRLVGFEMTGRGIARHGYPILHEGKPVGSVTSGSPGPTVGKNIGLGYVPRELSRPGTELGIEVRGKVVDAVVVTTPFYKR